MTFLEEEMGFQESDLARRRYKDLLLKVHPPCVPYVAMILNDLIVVENSHRNVQGKEGVVNFRKRREIYNVISMLDQYTTCDYSLIEIMDVANFLSNVSPLDPNDAWNLSIKIEPRNTKRSDIK